MVIKKALIIIRYAVPAAIAKLATFTAVDEKKKTLRSYGLVLWNTDMRCFGHNQFHQLYQENRCIAFFT